MNRTVLRLSVCMAVFGLALLASAPAEATCGFSRSFGNYPSAGACSYYCYVVTPESNASNINADYWTLGDPSINSGTYEWDGTDGSQAWGTLFTGGWSWRTDTENGLTNGCPSGSNMIAQLSDASGNYAYAAATEDTARPIDYDFGFGGSSITLQPIPALTISSSGRTGSQLDINVSWTDNSGSAFFDNGTGLTAGDIFQGFTVYKLEQARGSGAPADSAIGGWTATNGSGANSATVNFTCDDVANNEVWLALGVDYAGGFSSGHVGPPSTRIECDPNMANPEPRIRVIDRKDRTGRTPRSR